MATIAERIKPASFLATAFAWRRLRVAVGVSLVPWVMVLASGWKSGPHTLFMRTTALALTGLLVFSILERWPPRLPPWLARWVAQVVGVGLSMPLAMFAIYLWTTPEGAEHFWKNHDRLTGYLGLSFLGMFLAPWVALIALVRQKDVLVRDQQLRLDLQQSEFERLAAESRLRLLQAQVEPHFLFNTLANVRELVQSGSAKAPVVLESLIAYLRAAVPRLNDPVSTLGQELQLVRAYLDIMHMRMPDRLQIDVQVEEVALGLRCPPMTLLTLVENAVRHGIDPSEDGGRIEVRVAVREGRCFASVSDTGAGLRTGVSGLGTGLETLRERLRLVFGSGAQLRIEPQAPRGVRAEIEFPALGVR